MNVNNLNRLNSIAENKSVQPIKNNVFPQNKLNNTLTNSDIFAIKKSESVPFKNHDDLNEQKYLEEMSKLSLKMSDMPDVKTLPDFKTTPLRVGIAVEQKQATFYIPNGTLFVEDQNGKKEIGSFNNTNFTIKNDNNSLVLSKEDGSVVGIYKGKLSVEGNLSPIAINGKKYRGQMEVIIDPKNTTNLSVINDVLLEDYLKGVVPSESPASWPIESLKAQAVAARTYAVGNWKRRESLGFDLMSTTADQMYTGLSAEQASSTQAVTETTNQIITFNGKAINALFFSCSGGFTDSAKEVWNTDEYPYIQGVADFDQNAPKYKWDKTFTNNDLQKGLSQLGFDIGEIKEIKPIDFTEHKRVKTIEFTGTKGKATVDSNKFRFAVGLPSTLWEASPAKASSVLNRSPKEFNFKGGGWGHGLGMSQWGAKQMSENGKTYDQILKYYYTGIELSKL
ncbi:MAG: SpoIID/LytB domain-containing protein [Candidatus Sericytochromatia bacterium]|nr:SpoIID/LytB domain-containing protein [Candidatus Sericytochromatia bacterium]